MMMMRASGLETTNKIAIPADRYTIKSTMGASEVLDISFLQEGTLKSKDLARSLEENLAEIKEVFTPFWRRKSDPPRWAPQMTVSGDGQIDVLSQEASEQLWLAHVLKANPDVRHRLRQLRAQAVLLRLLNAQAVAQKMRADTPEQARDWMVSLIAKMRREAFLFRFESCQGRDISFLNEKGHLIPDWRYPTPEAHTAAI